MPASAELLDQWVWALVGQGRIDHARQVIAEALADPPSLKRPLNPLAEALMADDPSSLGLVADTLFEAGRFRLAREYYQKVAEIQPSGFVFGRLSHVCRFLGAAYAAAEHLRRALELEPDNAGYLANLGNALIMLGRTEEGVALARQAVERQADSAEVHSNYLFAMHYLPGQDRASLFEEHRRWGQRHAPMSLARRSYDNDPDQDRPLRIGYLSADFRTHSVAYTFEAVLDARDRLAFQVFGYGSVAHPDGVTRRLQSKCDVYRDVYGLADPAVANLIEQDRVDILVALAGHTIGHRLLVCAYRPAPIQMDFGGINTTGMRQVDYRLTDGQLDPPGSEQYYLERSIHLPGGMVCYRPPGFAPAVGPLPAMRNGRVTFGSFNGSQKVHPDLVSLWSAVMNAVEGARLLMKFPGGDDPVLAGHYLRLFEQRGVHRDRIQICGWLSPEAHLDLYNQVDIALDSYPFNGCLTTLEGLWMGVPIVTLAGQTLISRVGLSILSRVGLEHLAASTVGEYVERAVVLARNTKALGQIRSSLRPRMAGSSLCDSKAYVRDLEAAYRRVWRQWCDTQIQKDEKDVLHLQPTTHHPKLTRQGGRG